MGSSEEKCDFVVLVLLGGKKKKCVQKHLGSELTMDRFREAALESHQKSSDTLDGWSLIMRRTDQKEKQRSREEKWGDCCTCQCFPKSPSQ